MVIIGGAKDKEGDCRILAEFIRLAGGPRARIVVLAVASDMPHEAAARYLEIFDWLGACDVQLLDVRRRVDANARPHLKTIERASGVFFTSFLTDGPSCETDR